jgi:hypothetical protein
MKPIEEDLRWRHQRPQIPHRFALREDPRRGRAVAQQFIPGSGEPLPVADLDCAEVAGTRGRRCRRAGAGGRAAGARGLGCCRPSPDTSPPYSQPHSTATARKRACPCRSPMPPARSPWSSAPAVRWHPARAPSAPASGPTARRGATVLARELHRPPFALSEAAPCLATQAQRFDLDDPGELRLSPTLSPKPSQSRPGFRSRGARGPGHRPAR